MRGELSGSPISELIAFPLLRLFVTAMGLSAVTDLLHEVAAGALVTTVLPSSPEKLSCLLERRSEFWQFEMASIRH